METYRVYGALNAFDVWPCFLQPVFTNGDRLYFQMHANGKICGFEEIHTELDIKDRIIPLDVRDDFKIGDDVFYAVGFSKDDIVSGDCDDIILDFDINQDKYLSNEDFGEDIKYFLIKYGV